MPWTTPETYVSYCKRILEQELARRRRYERIRNGAEPASNLDLEYLLSHIANLAGCRERDAFHGLASVFDIFTDRQRALLHSLLTDIVEKRPRKPGWLWRQAFQYSTPWYWTSGRSGA